MKIRRKPGKLARHTHPLYIIGYSSPPPQPAEVRAWFDLEYGGPLTFKEDAVGPSTLTWASHGPWNVAVQISLPPEEASSWQERLHWGHPRTGLVLPTSAPTSKSIDLILHAARLARGLTLLTGGTAYDVIAHEYLNPSDWKDRPLDRFKTGDHVVVDQEESGDPGLERFYTRGLTKFKLDELDTFRPLGLPSRPVLEGLRNIADEILLAGYSLKVGTTLEIPRLGLTLRIIRHRTTAPAEGSVPTREIVWDQRAGED
jgi:hypothetical protein